MEEKTYVGFNFGRFENDDGKMQDYCNVFMLEDFNGTESNDYHFGGQKAVKLARFPVIRNAACSSANQTIGRRCFPLRAQRCKLVAHKARF